MRWERLGYKDTDEVSRKDKPPLHSTGSKVDTMTKYEEYILCEEWAYVTFIGEIYMLQKIKESEDSPATYIVFKPNEEVTEVKNTMYGHNYIHRLIRQEYGQNAIIPAPRHKYFRR